MDDHLTDLAALEWARFGETRLAPEGSAAVTEHLEGCAGCRKRVEDFGRMERLMHPWGEAGPEDRRPVVFRRVVVGVVVVVVIGLMGWVVWG
jgi:hypothetical protein